MRLWPFGRERREALPAPVSGFTDMTAAAALEAATASPDAPNGLALLQAAAALIGRCCAAAELSGDAAALFPAPLRELVGRAVTLRGEALLAAVGDRLLPVGHWSITGRADPADWMYTCDLAGPSATETVTLPAAQVLHFRANVDPAAPWRGNPPGRVAAATAATAIMAERGARDATAIAPTWLVYLRDRLTPDQNMQLAEAMQIGFGKRRGFMALGGGPSGEYVGPQITESHEALRNRAASELAAVAGVPVALLLGQAEGGALREHYRRLSHTVLAPLGRTIEAEAGSKGLSIAVDFAPLFASDTAGRARALGILVKAGMALPEALAAVGLSDGVDGDRDD